jgi:hypothetical protein
MKSKKLLMILSSTVLACAVTSLAVAQNAISSQAPARLKAYTAVRPPVAGARPQSSSGPQLQIFHYKVTSSRDGNTYSGVMVGQSPFSSGSNKTSKIPTQIVPIVITTNSIGTSVNSDGSINTTPGTTVLDPTVANSACLAPPNDVPLTLFKQSPIFKHANFSFGGTFVGKTQYLDAFQRANFWSDIKGDNYHTYLRPLTITGAVSINVPSNHGLSLATDSLGSPDFCAPLGIIDINWLDTYLNDVVLPSLTSQGVNPGTFPIFLLANVVTAFPFDNLGGCCFLGYHSSNAGQTYSPMDFDTTGLFGPTIFDTSIAAHETGEWMDDPFGSNPVPAWGHIGQQGGCQTNLEVGDPLTGTNVPDVTMPNGYTYHLQELAFFSWFYGAPSIAVNGWYSDNNTFTTDAGPPCM